MTILDVVSVFEEPMKKYRYQCQTCKAKGRWHVNPNDAGADGERHYDKHVYGHECSIFSDEGNNVGPAH